MDNKNELFTEQIDLGTSAYKNLTTAYREMQLLISKLNSGTRKQMEIISEIEEGFDKDGEDSILILTNEISSLLHSFNDEIDNNINLFKTCINDSVNHYKKAITYYSAEKSELSELVKVRKTLLYLVALIEKFRNRVIGVSSSLNVLPALTKELKSVQKVFDKEAKKLLVVLKIGQEECSNTAKLIEKTAGTA
tara:strand:+ start:3158 stop:3736 length:579 start_codon:yes stop_codon:yes gene_type:complete